MSHKQRTFTHNPKDVLSDLSSGNELSGNDTPHAKTGRPRDRLLDKLTRPLPVEPAPDGGAGKKRYRCAAPKCSWDCTGRAAGRVLKHASECMFLTSELRHAARKVSTANAPSSRLARLEAEHAQRQVVPTEPLFSGRSAMTNHNDPAGESEVQPHAGAGHTPLEVYVGNAGRALLMAKLHFVIVCLFCIHAIPPSIVDSDEWKEMWEIGNTKYKPASANILAETQIPQEAQRVRELQVAFLKTKRNLTITYDGGANRRRESYYTIHVMTPAEATVSVDGNNGCHPFLIEAAAGTGFSHTGQWIGKQMLRVSSLAHCIEMMTSCTHLPQN